MHVAVPVLMDSQCADAFGDTRAAGAETAPCILLVEDDAEFRTLIAEELREAGYEVVEARNGGEMLDYVSRSVASVGCCPPPHLIITDVRMPGLSGFDVVVGLQLARYGVPVIFITAFGSAELHEHAAALGAVAIFDKPFEIADLLQTVAEAVR